MRRISTDQGESWVDSMHQLPGDFVAVVFTKDDIGNIVDMADLFCSDLNPMLVDEEVFLILGHFRRILNASHDDSHDGSADSG